MKIDIITLPFKVYNASDDYNFIRLGNELTIDEVYANYTVMGFDMQFVEYLQITDTFGLPSNLWQLLHNEFVMSNGVDDAKHFYVWLKRR